MGKVWDITRPPRSIKKTRPVIDDQASRIAHIFLSEICNQCLISELHKRGVTIEEVFGQYYAIEEMASAKNDELFGNDEEGQHGQVLTVGDVELAGFTTLPKLPLDRQPF